VAGKDEHPASNIERQTLNKKTKISFSTLSLCFSVIKNKKIYNYMNSKLKT